MSKKVEDTVKFISELDPGGWAGFGQALQNKNKKPVITSNNSSTSDPGGWKGFANSVPDINQSAKDLLPGVSAIDKTMKGDYSGAAKDAAIDAATIAVGGVAGKVLGKTLPRISSAITRNPVKSTIAGSALAGSSGSDSSSNQPSSTMSTSSSSSSIMPLMSPMIKPSVSVASAKKTKRKLVSTKLRPKLEAVNCKYHKKAQRKMKIIDENFLKESVRDALNRIAHDASWNDVPKKKDPKEKPGTKVIINPQLKGTKDNV